MSEDERDIKVTDKRLFTSEGDLREGSETPGRPRQSAEEPQAAQAGSEPAPPSTASAPTEPAAPPREAPESPPPAADGFGAPTFSDLVAILAEPIAIYLGDAPLPDGSSAENHEAARLYIDLLDILQQKTAGNLSPDEATFVEGLLYQLRMRYLQKTG